METDAAFLLRVLSDGHPHTLNEILQRSFAERGCGLTVHSRAADLRKQGHRVVNESVPGAKRGAGSTYRLVQDRETPARAAGADLLVGVAPTSPDTLTLPRFPSPLCRDDRFHPRGFGWPQTKLAP